jgi:hypothetical protein
MKFPHRDNILDHRPQVPTITPVHLLFAAFARRCAPGRV